MNIYILLFYDEFITYSTPHLSLRDGIDCMLMYILVYTCKRYLTSLVRLNQHSFSVPRTFEPYPSKMSYQIFVPSQSSHVPINPKLVCKELWLPDMDECDEEDDYRIGTIDFQITLPLDESYPQCRGAGRTLKFNCRDRSAGVLLPSEPAAPAASQDGRVDPFFFEKGFDLEAMTGFQVWPGSRLMIETFTCHVSTNGRSSRAKRLHHWQESLSRGGLNILEVGAGMGVVGSCLAAAGGNVLITDLPVLVENGIKPNLRRNSAMMPTSSPYRRPDFLISNDTVKEEDALSIGKGWACADVLDWFKPVPDQLSRATSSSIDVIIACDCVFLRKLVDPLLNTVSTIFEHSKSRSPKLLFTFQRRNMMGVFISMEELLVRIEERGWGIECLAWRTVNVEGDGIHENYLFEVSPEKSTAEEPLFLEEKVGKDS